MDEQGVGVMGWWEHDELVRPHEDEEFNRGLPEEPEFHHAPSPEPPVLVNPFDDDLEPAYTQTITNEGIEFAYHGAGAIVEKAEGTLTRWERLLKKYEEEFKDSEYGQWKTKHEWEDAQWMATAKVSQASLKCLLQTEWFVKCPPKFGSVKTLFDIIDKQLADFGGPKFKLDDMRLKEALNDQHCLVWRNVRKCGDFLLGNPKFAPGFAFGPIVKLNTEGDQRTLPLGTTLGAGILMSDATQLSMFTGDVSVHGVYMSLGNIDKDIRADISKGAWLLVAIIPKSKWSKTLAALPNLTKER
ncbi:hypothetical protein FRC06_007708 [Ceratobasidium sp. 370]|nr:hypothetical protein FRC06_007708 [Ceratobasidium sp. 370]